MGPWATRLAEPPERIKSGGLNVGFVWNAAIKSGKHFPMAQIQRTIVTLRFCGDDLNPQELSNRLGAMPSKAHEKGTTLHSASGARIAKTGIWNLAIEAKAPDDFDVLVTRLFDQLNSSLETWLDLSGRFQGNLFIGLFLDSSNEGFSISRETIRAIASRGLELGFDIYGPTNE